MKNSKGKMTAEIQGIILDMDGVLWRGQKQLGNLPAIFQIIRDLGLRVVMATNNASRSPKQYVERLSGYGVTVEAWQIVNSGMATAHYLKESYPQGGGVYVVGEPALVEELEQAGFPHSMKDPLAVVAALDRTITYEKMTKAALFIRKGIPFIGTNPDRSYPIPEGEAPGAGAILAALEAATGISPIVIGKPQARMYAVALEQLGTSIEETLVVGDRLETDILGAQNFGLPCALVLSGVTSLESAQNWQPPPDFITPDLTSLLNLLQGRAT